MNNAPILELTDVKTTKEIFELRAKYFEDQEGLERQLKKRSDTKKQMAPFQLPNTDISWKRHSFNKLRSITVLYC